MVYAKEAEFEQDLIKELFNKGWEHEVIKYPSEQDLLNNWAVILFENNRGIDCLNDQPLTESEMQQILEQITALKTPLKLNGFINGKTVIITRDNPDDALHVGKEVSLKIYDRHEIAAGQSRYQIVQQPQFKNKSKILNDRRGDLMLLINGMPVIHIELKKSGVAVAQAYQQIEKYAAEGVFTGLFALVQVFVAMQPQETVYFANPGSDGKFNRDFYFHWADFNNEPLNNWQSIASTLLSIPMAHQLIGFYTVADNSDGVLKVMRSYQYYAANAISDKVKRARWNDKNILGGYVWHTTGSGKTMTSFKSAQLIANSKDADKVVFLMDRIELGTQSLREYQGFADDKSDVQKTTNTMMLISKLKSNKPDNTLIVTSIQKMSNIQDEGLNANDIAVMQSKRVVFIIDEAHRSTFGKMLIIIKETFPNALFFGFTGTPIRKANQKKMSTTATVFGDELHRYSIADGIRDGNVLGFDPYRVMTYRDKDLRKAVALQQAKADSQADALSDSKKKQVFNKFMQQVPMAGFTDGAGKYHKGIEDYLPKAQYKCEQHRKKVVEDIAENWVYLSRNYKFHALFATSSIAEAIEYYRLIKQQMPELKVSALFDPNIDENDGALFKQEGLVEIIEDYNQRYNQDFSLKNQSQFKKDMAARLAHKSPYIRIQQTPEQQIDLLIVVDQMLTGFDSKWLNTLYLDKLLKYESIIQAFSRTNRLFGPDKRFGTIRYYKLPHSMERNINAAVELYSGDKPIDLFVDKLPHNLTQLNASFDEIVELFSNANVANFEKLPDETAERGQFAKLFKIFSAYLDAALIQGFKWSQLKYSFVTDKKKIEIELKLDEQTYLILALRYKELSSSVAGGGSSDAVPFEIENYLTEIDTGVIDADYMNTRFDKYLKTLEEDSVDKQHTLDELHKSFASLTQEEQKYANLFIHDVQRGQIKLEKDKTFRQYITEYQFSAKQLEIDKIVQIFSLDRSLLKNMMNTVITKANINQYGRFDELKKSVDRVKAKAYFEELHGKSIPAFKVNINVHNLLQDFIIAGGFDITQMPIE